MEEGALCKVGLCCSYTVYCWPIVCPTKVHLREKSHFSQSAKKILNMDLIDFFSLRCFPSAMFPPYASGAVQ